MLGEQAIDLAGHEGPKARHLATANSGPFAVRARQDEQTVRETGQPHGAEDLDFLAAHHVGHVALAVAEAGNDGDAAALDPVQVLRQLGRPGGTSDIRCLSPALAAAGHAGDQAGSPAGFQPARELLGEHAGKVAVWNIENAERCALLLEYPTRLVEQRAAQRARPPVDGDQARHACSVNPGWPTPPCAA